ncbi:MAG: EamA family transporter [Alphaproteobacteria bacterium]|nr:EamA family transporter [Alphaproteobacteria bacterium]
MSPRNLGLAILAPLCWGLTFTLAKPVVTHFPPLFMMLMVYAGIGLVMAATHRTPFKTGWPKLLLISALSVTIQGGLLFYAVKEVDATTSNLVLQAQVPAGVVLGWLIAGEPLNPSRIVGMLVAVLGVVIVIGLPEKKPPLIPVLTIVLSGFVWAAGQVLARVLSQDSGLMVLKANAWFATPQLVVATLLLEQGQWQAVMTATPFQWLLFGFVGVFGFYVAYMTWFTLLKRVSVDQAVPFILLMTPIGLVGAVVFLGETITPVQLIGGAVLMLGLAIVNGVGVPRRFKTA